MKSYTGLIQLHTFEDRFSYLNLTGRVGEGTFGYNRIFNQQFYHSSEWRRVRNGIILRDNGCDLGVPGYEIHGRIYIHHIVPITLEDIQNGEELLFDPNNLICVSKQTHDAIHYGSANTLPKIPIERTPGDTCPWR